MKRKIQILIFILSVGSLTLNAQSPPSYQSAPEAENTGPVGGNAPLGSSLTMFLVLGAAYGLTKAYKPGEEAEETEETE